MNPTSKTDLAIQSFYSGLNCAQSVVSAYSSQLNTENKLLMDITSGFGGGMGKMQDTCGAVTGAFMILGLISGQKSDNNNELKSIANQKINDFCEIFEQKHHTLYCRSLLRCDLNSEKGRSFYHQNDLKKTVCSKCITDAIKIVDYLESQTSI